MVISHKNKYLFISIPKCATHSIYDCLVSSFDGTRHGIFHNYEVPEIAEDYYKFMCIRNPYERAISAFHGIQQGKTLKYDNEIFEDCRNPLDMNSLFEWAIEKGMDLPTGWLRPQWHFISMIKNVDQLIDFNAMADEFKSLPFYSGQSYNFKKINNSNHASWQIYMTQKRIALINEMYKDDFINLNFHKL